MSERDTTRPGLPTLFGPPAEHARRLAAAGGDPAGRHRAAAETLADWIAGRLAEGGRADVVVVCTGNSRRSMLGATMGHVAAAESGLLGVRFFSGGTAPTAFNPRTIAALTAIGVEVEPTGREAPRGASGEPNPIHRVRWGEGLEAIEFSKRYDDPANPRQGFAAVMVCDEADAGCPVVAGAAIRIAMPFADPKDHDGTPGESAAYAARRDEIGRVMLHVMRRVRERLEAKGD